MTTVIEHVTYKLKADAGVEKLQQTHAGVNQFCQQQQGFLYRSLSEDAQGLWHDIVYWENQAAADAAADAFMQTPECVALAELCAKETLKMKHMSVETQVCSQTSTQEG